MKKLFVFVAALVAGLTISAVAIASRNSSGTFSLPTGNPVVSGTTISSTVHNNTMSDIATELTDSLSRSNKGAMLGNLELVAGNDTCASPALTWDGDEDTGLIRSAANTLGICTGGSSRVAISSTGVAVTGAISATTTISATGAIKSGSPSGGAIDVGVSAIGGSTGIEGGYFQNATDTTDTVERAAIATANGGILLAHTELDETTGVTNSLYKGNIPKLWATIAISNANPFVPSVADNAGFNVASVSRVDDNTIQVVIADDMGSANYAVSAIFEGYARSCILSARTTSSFNIQCYNTAGAFDLDSLGAGASVTVMVMGNQ